MTSAGLVVDLERPLPRTLALGKPTATFCYGTCWHPDADVQELRIVVDGEPHPVAEFGMRRNRSGRRERAFWAIVPIAERTVPRAIHVELRAVLRTGVAVQVPLARIDVEESEPLNLAAKPERSGADLIAICMATFEPDLELFRAQIDSLRAQDDRQWVCVISDDCSSSDRLAEMQRIIGEDDRFALSRSQERRGFYRNFERALAIAPPTASLFALCDQDDRWHSDKLTSLRTALGDAHLVYSDQRLVDADGRVLRETLWKGRRNNSTNLASMLVANTVTGAATLFRREVVDLAVPFPDTPGFQFHDHWLAVTALAAGDVAYVDRPLYDYVQHPGAIFGDVSSGASGGRPWFRGLTTPRQALTAARAAYFYGYLPRTIQAQVALLRCSNRVSPRKSRTLRRFIDASRSPVAFAWLALRPMRQLAGLNETLGSEAALARGLAWNVGASTWRRRAPRWMARIGDAAFPGPASFEQPRLRRWRADVW